MMRNRIVEAMVKLCLVGKPHASQREVARIVEHAYLDARAIPMLIALPEHV